MNRNYCGADRSRRAAVGVLAAVTLVLTGCGQAEDARQRILDAVAGEGEEPVTVTTVISHVESNSGDVDAGTRARPHPTVTSEPARTPRATPVDDRADGRTDDDAGGSANPMGFATSAPTSSGTVRASSPACDSRGILIVESVIVHPGDDARRTIGAALDRNPGAEFTTPGACPSLRAHVDGGDVYAVYVDYGRDTGSLCGAAASTGGNARVLSSRNEYLSPC
ncbi:hypothetical protein [Corynebacterium xerosis]|uniref:Uncharacterized protein n=1 Tax=Corynebacterium xerosis TaxID=1725 RepID=A0A7X9SV29_9CORY|nr:hypothetical protein [Corynebacterium xerosis]NMF08640.1 hypothetical protein [Corynebacterium xerosis]